MITQADAVMIAEMIAEFGNTITLSGGVTTVKAIVETSYDEIRKSVRDSELSKASGNVVLFYLSKTDAAKIPNGCLLPYQGELFTLAESKTAVFSDVTLLVVMLGASGGYA